MQLKLRLFVWGLLGLCATNGFAANFDWNGGTGSWDDTSQWDSPPAGTDFDGTSGNTFTASSGTVQVTNAPATTLHTFGGQLTISGNGDINAYSGATLFINRTNLVAPPNAATITDLHLNGGRLNFNSGNNDTDYNGNINVVADSVLLSLHATHWNGSITGSGNISYAGFDANRFFEIESPAANTFSGDWNITASGLRNRTAGGLGTGAVTVQSGATLSVYANINSTSSVTMKSGSIMEFNGTGTFALGTVILEGANLDRKSANNSNVTLNNGTIAVNGDSTITNDKVRYLRFDTTFSGSSSLTVDNNNGFIELNTDNEISGFTGDWIVKDGALRLLNEKGLGVTGAGNLTIDQSTNADAVVDYFSGTYDVTVAGLTLDNGSGAVEILGSETGITYNIATDSFSSLNFADFFNGTGTITVLAEAIPSVAIPEPGSLSLLGIGLLALLSRRRRNN